MRSLDEINEQFNLNLNLITYMRLGAAINFYLRQRARVVTGLAVGLAGFLNRFKKGSKQIRKILITKTNPPYIVQQAQHVRSYAELTDTAIPNEKSLTFWLNSWNNIFYRTV